MKNTRMPPDERKSAAIRAAIQLGEEKGLGVVTMSSVAKEMGITSNALTYHFKSAEAFLCQVVEAAVAGGHARITACAVVAGHPSADSLSPQARAEAFAAFR